MNKKMLLIAIPAVGVCLLVLVAKVINKKDDPKTENSKTGQSLLDPNVNNDADSISSKKKIYQKGVQEKEDKEEIQKNSNISFDEMGNVEGSKPTKSNDLSYNNDDSKKEVRSVSQTISTENRQKGKSSQPKSNIQKKQKVEEKQQDPEKGQTNQFANYSGIYLGSNTKNNTAAGGQAEKFIAAMLDDDKVIKNNSSVIFHLTEDAEIDGIKFKKYSTVYAQASTRTGYFDITSNYIQNGYDGKKYPVKLNLYNENYTRGINYDDNVNDAVKGSKNTAVDEMSYQATSGNPLANTATSVVKNVIKGKGENKVSIYAGYKVYFKKETL